MQEKSLENIAAAQADLLSERWNAAIARLYYGAFQQLIASLPSDFPTLGGAASHRRTFELALPFLQMQMGKAKSEQVFQAFGELRRLRNTADYKPQLFDKRTAWHAELLSSRIIQLLKS
jgi:hypothetical protein